MENRELEDENNDNGENSGMEDLVARTIRGSQRLGLEDLLASELASAVLSEPLSKVRHIYEALMLLSEEERKSVGITEEELRETQRLYVMAETLRTTHIFREISDTGQTIDLWAMICWSFPVEEAKEWLEWVGDDFRDKVRWYPHDGHENPNEKYRNLPYHECIYNVLCNEEVIMATFKGLVVRFVNFAMPKATKLMRKIIGRVSQDTFLATLRILRSKRTGGGSPWQG